MHYHGLNVGVSKTDTEGITWAERFMTKCYQLELERQTGQQLRALATFAEVLGSVPCTHNGLQLIILNSSSRDYGPSSGSASIRQ